METSVPHPLPVFVFQLLWFLLVWASIARLVVWPWSRRLGANARVAVWIAPQMFRVLGLGLLVPMLAPGMPRDFAVATAIGDTATAVLALTAFVALHRDWPMAMTLAWSCTLVGSVDLLIAFPHALHAGALEHLAAQWYVPVLAGPLMVVSHVAGICALLQRGAAD